MRKDHVIVTQTQDDPLRFASNYRGVKTTCCDTKGGLTHTLLHRGAHAPFSRHTRDNGFMCGVAICGI